MSANDLHLGASSPARGAGTDLTAMGYAVDLDRRLRASPPSVGAYEHASDTPDAGMPIDASIVVPPGSDAGRLDRDAASNADAGTSVPAPSGCACRAGTHCPALTAPTLLTFALALALRRRRSRRAP